MVNSELKCVFENYQQHYSKIFDYMYPAKNSTGFTERNLSVNFIKGYESARAMYDEKIVSWYEFQFGEKNNYHVDAVMWNISLGELYVIESKRFDNPSAKIREIDADINRIYALVDELKSECATSKQRIPINNISQIFGVILADAWNETKIKNNIITSYREKSFIGKYLATERIKNPIYDVREFNQSKTLEKYKLLSLAWELI